MTVLRGVVHSGSGFDAKLVERDQEVFAEALGIRLYPGSLNVHLAHPIAFSKYKQIGSRGCERMCIDATLNGRRVIVSHRIPLQPPARRRILVFAEERLRDTLQLVDGSSVVLEFADGIITDVGLIDHLALTRVEYIQRLGDVCRMMKRSVFKILKYARRRV